MTLRPNPPPPSPALAGGRHERRAPKGGLGRARRRPGFNWPGERLLCSVQFFPPRPSPSLPCDFLTRPPLASTGATAAGDCCQTAACAGHPHRCCKHLRHKGPASPLLRPAAPRHWYAHEYVHACMHTHTQTHTHCGVRLKVGTSVIAFAILVKFVSNSVQFTTVGDAGSVAGIADGCVCCHLQPLCAAR